MNYKIEDLTKLLFVVDDEGIVESFHPGNKEEKDEFLSETLFKPTTSLVIEADFTSILDHAKENIEYYRKLAYSQIIETYDDLEEWKKEHLSLEYVKKRADEYLSDDEVILGKVLANSFEFFEDMAKKAKALPASNITVGTKSLSEDLEDVELTIKIKVLFEDGRRKIFSSKETDVFKNIQEID